MRVDLLLDPDINSIKHVMAVGSVLWDFGWLPRISETIEIDYTPYVVSEVRYCLPPHQARYVEVTVFPKGWKS